LVGEQNNQNERIRPCPDQYLSRPVFVRKLTKTEQAKIARLIRSNEDARVVRRAQMIRLSSQGKKNAEIAESLLKEAVQKSPRDFGYSSSSWTLDRLREYLGQQTGTLLNPRYLSQLMARQGIVYRRPKHVMAHLRNAKDYNEKKALLEFLKNAQSKAAPTSTFSTSTNVKFTCTQH